VGQDQMPEPRAVRGRRLDRSRGLTTVARGAPAADVLHTGRQIEALLQDAAPTVNAFAKAGEHTKFKSLLRLNPLIAGADGRPWPEHNGL
jgi:hypothetical protein